MKPTPTSATPAMKTINGKKCVRVLDLAKKWGTSTATILATDKPHAVPDKYIHRMNRRAWCELEGLRLRAEAVKDRKSSYISREILAFLDGLEKPAVPTPETPTDLGTAALIADARRIASQAAAKAENNEKRAEKLEKHMNAAELVVKSAANIAEEASEAVDRIDNTLHNVEQKATEAEAEAYAARETANTAQTTAQNAADLAQENADIVSGEIERLTRLSDDMDKAKKKAAARHDDALARIMSAERKQRDNTARIQTLEEHARAIDWTLAAVAVLGVVGRLIRLLHRR